MDGRPALSANTPTCQATGHASTLDDISYAQEIEATFVGSGNAVYYAFNRQNNVDPRLFDDLNKPLRAGTAFNVNPLRTVVGQRDGLELYILAEICLSNAFTYGTAAELAARYPRRDITIYPDPTGKARPTTAPVGDTDFTILQKAGFTVSAPAQPYAVRDKIIRILLDSDPLGAGFDSAAPAAEFSLSQVEGLSTNGRGFVRCMPGGPERSEAKPVLSAVEGGEGVSARRLSIMWNPYYYLLGLTLFYLGELAQAQEYLEQSFALYDPQRDNPFVSGAVQDTRISGLGFVAWILGMRGYPDQALQRIQEALSFAQELAHPFSFTDNLSKNP